ncbi:MAG: transcription elongation factor GreA [Anaerolineae bacterium]|nr:transcription elongation factor GreA [Anaerolineae bacterium]
MSNVNENYLTKEGAAKLRTELDELKGPQRQDLAKRLREAIQQGDLSENADYSKAKEDQSFLEGRIKELEALLGTATIIDENSSSNGEVTVGSWVTIQENGSEPEKYHLVGPAEAKPREGRISHESPIGLALMGRIKGDKVTVETPGGKTIFAIIAVE